MQKLSAKLKNVPKDASQVLCSTSSQLNKDQSLSVESIVLTDNNSDDLVLNSNKVLKCFCLLCNKKDLKQLGNHLRKTHNMNINEYIIMFPDAKISSTNYNKITRNNISKSLKGKTFSDEHCNNLSIACKKSYIENPERGKNHSETLKENYASGKIKPVVHSEETKKSISKNLKGKFIKEKNSMHGKKHNKKTLIKMSINTSNENNGMYSKKHSDKTRNKMRESRIAYIEKIYNDGLPITPNIGKTEKQILDDIELKENIKIIRQYKVLNYFIDGYCEKLNIAFEIDEKHHFDVTNNFKDKDLKRQKEIENKLKCIFIRIKT